MRELFRNLVTAQGTRAVREREELLSVFETRIGRARGRAAKAGGGGLQTRSWTRGC